MSTAPWEGIASPIRTPIGPRVGPGSSAPSLGGSSDDGCTHHRRVRHEVRDALAVMGFSAVTSSLLALLLMLLVRTGG